MDSIVVRRTGPVLAGLTLGLALVLSSVAPTRAAGPDCADWLEQGFWKQATSADVHRCLIAGAMIEARDRWGETPLHRAAYAGQTETVRALIEAGAVIETRDRLRATPLHWAAYGGQTETVRVLLDAGANIAAVDSWYETPLHRAAYGGQTETVRALIDAGANIAATTVDPNGNGNGNGWTPLHMAAEGGHTETIRALLDTFTGKAIAGQGGSYGRTPFELLPPAMEGTDVYRRLQEAHQRQGEAPE